MKVKIRAKDVRLTIPVPLAIFGVVIRLLPDRIFNEMRADVPEPYYSLITKETVCMALREYLGILKEYRGLVLVHVEAKDGTLVTVKF